MTERSGATAQSGCSTSVPLSREQRAALAYRDASGTFARYVIGRSAYAEGLDERRWTEAVALVAERHPVFRSTLRDGQLCEGPVGAMVQLVDARTTDDVVRASIESFLARPDPRRPVVSTLVHRLTDGRHRVTIVADHLGVDHVSLGVLISELDAFYRDPAAVLPPPSDPRVLVDSESAFLASARLSSAEAYVRATVEDCPVLDLGEDPVDERAFEPESHWVEAPSIAWPNALLPALSVAFGLALDEHRRDERGRMGVLLNARRPPLHRPAIGLGANAIPVRLELDRRKAFGALLDSAAARIRGAIRHRQLPGYRVRGILRELELPSTAAFVNYMPVLRRDGVGQALQVLNGDLDGEAFTWGGMSCRAVSMRRHGNPYDLTLNLIERLDKPPVLRFDYNRRRYAPEAVAALADRLVEALRRLTAAPRSSVSHACAIAPALADTVVRELTGDFSGLDDRPLVDAAFVDEARAHPDRVAVIDEDDTQTTYRDLENWSARVAASVAAMRSGARELVVAVDLPRSAAALAAIYGVLRAGAAYVPLPLDAPANRRRTIVRRAGARVYIGLGEPPSDLGVFDRCLTIGALAPAELPVPVRAHDPRALAMVLFTSGTTGEPKGAAITHENLQRMVFDRACFEVERGQRVLSMSPLTFDLSIYDAIAVVANGATSVQAPARVLDRRALEHTLRRHTPTHAFMSTAVFHALTDSDFRPLATLERIIVGGDVLSRVSVDRFRSWGSSTAIVNGYGPTECTTVVSSERVGGWRAPSIPIGRPVDGTRLYVLDSDGRLCAPGVRGEICCGGAGLSRGYIGQPRLTAERFVPDAHGPVAGARVYRTGDIGSLRPDGKLLYVGRRDRQVKLRAVRVELGEVEIALARHPGVQSVLADVRPVGDRPALVAFVTGRATPEELRAHAARELPPQMVPAHFVVLDELPLTAHGKIDRRRLPDVRPDPLADAGRSRPQTELEATIARAWASALGRTMVAVDRNMFDQGADSERVLAAQVALEAALGREVPIALLFEHPTIAALARRLGSGREADDARMGAAERGARRLARRSGRA